MLDGRARAICDVPPCGPFLRKIGFSGLEVGHFGGDVVAFGEVLQDHPWCANPAFSLYSISQKGLEE